MKKKAVQNNIEASVKEQPREILCTELSIPVAREVLDTCLKAAEEIILDRFIDSIKYQYASQDSLQFVYKLAKLSELPYEHFNPEHLNSLTSVEPPHPGTDALASQMIPTKAVPINIVREKLNEPAKKTLSIATRLVQFKRAAQNSKNSKNRSARNHVLLQPITQHSQINLEQALEEDRLRTEIMYRSKMQKQKWEQQVKEEEAITKKYKKRPGLNPIGPQTYNFNGKPLSVKKVKNLPDLFRLKSKWTHQQDTSLLPSNSEKCGNARKVDMSMDALLLDKSQNVEEDEDKDISNYYEYMKQLRSIKVSPGVFLTIKKEEEEADDSPESSIQNKTAVSNHVPIAEEPATEEEPALHREPLKLPILKKKYYTPMKHRPLNKTHVIKHTIKNY